MYTDYNRELSGVHFWRLEVSMPQITVLWAWQTLLTARALAADSVIKMTAKVRNEIHYVMWESKSIEKARFLPLFCYKLFVIDL